jgi:hypothetical protein
MIAVCGTLTVVSEVNVPQMAIIASVRLINYARG